MLKAIIFDAYGTLINTGDGSVQATKHILDKNNAALDAKTFYARWKVLQRSHIDSLESFVTQETIFLITLKKIYAEYSIKGDAEQDINIMLATLGIRNAYPETRQTVIELRKSYKVYIGSTTDEAPLISDLTRNEIVVDGCFTSEGLGAYKPSKVFFDSILEKINLQAEETIYVGDSQIDDLLGPKSVGMKTVWINRKNDRLKEGIPNPDYEIKSLSELLDLCI